MPIRNEWEFRIFGMSRSGHHAILLWLAGHFPPRSVYFMNAVRLFRDPFESHSDTRSTTEKIDSFLDRKESAIVYDRYVQKHCLMYNYENANLAALATRHPVPRKLRTVGASKKELTLLILRDPYNNLASRWKHPRICSNKLALRRWVSYAEEFIGITDHLGPKILINYNKWFSDLEYRRSISAKIGISFTDKALNRVAANGAGSSWDGISFDGHAQSMDVLTRWREATGDVRFRQLFLGRNDVRKLSESIFGKIPGTESLFGNFMNASRMRHERRGEGAR